MIFLYFIRTILLKFKLWTRNSLDVMTAPSSRIKTIMAWHFIPSAFHLVNCLSYSLNEKSRKRGN